MTVRPPKGYSCYESSFLILVPFVSLTTICDHMSFLSTKITKLFLFSLLIELWVSSSWWVFLGFLLTLLKVDRSLLIVWGNCKGFCFLQSSCLPYFPAWNRESSCRSARATICSQSNLSLLMPGSIACLKSGCITSKNFWSLMVSGILPCSHSAILSISMAVTPILCTFPCCISDT